MTSTQLLAIEYALDFLGKHGDDSSIDHSIALCDLFDDARKQYYAFDDSKKSLIDFMRQHAVQIPQSEFDLWRMLPLREQLVGEINALPESRGTVRATNGILCYIEQAQGLYGPAHYEFFVPDEVQAVRITHKGTPRKENKENDALAGLLASL